jgi:NhaA family Na+:H+ antiporter
MHVRTAVEEESLRHTWSESERFIPRVVVQPLQRFMDLGAASAVVMLVAAAVAVLWANSPFGESYRAFFDAQVQIVVGPWDGLSSLSIREWLNDGAMTLFFFVVALEIKRELVSGELRRPRAAALPVLAALGGMVVPALIYLALNAGGPGVSGWGVPMATDIAFAVAVVTAVGSRVPPAARVFLLTLAIADDLGAIVVIAVFYASELVLLPLLGAIASVGIAAVLQRIHVRSPVPYVVLAVGCWLLLHHSGVHPTLAGVAFGLVTPAWPWYDPRQFPERARAYAAVVEEATPSDLTSRGFDVVRAAIGDTARLAAESQAPLDRLERRLSSLVSFVVVPAFALANSGIDLSGVSVTGVVDHPVTLGVATGLVVGKTVGIFGTTWLATRSRLLVLPSGTTWPQMLGVSICAGIGFTVALFVADIAFVDTAAREASKVGIFVGSLVSGVVGFAALRLAVRRPVAPREHPDAS